MLENAKRKFFDSDSAFNSFSVGAISGAFLITIIVCISLLVSMVYADTLPGMPGFRGFSGGDETQYYDAYFNTLNFKMVVQANGLISVYSTENLTYYGDVSWAGSVNTAGARGSSAVTVNDVNGNPVQLQCISDIIWNDKLISTEVLKFNYTNYGQMVSSFSDPAYNSYADNFSDIVVDYDDTLQGYVKNFYFTSLSEQNCQWIVEMSEDCPDTVTVNVTPVAISYSAYTTGLYISTGANTRTMSELVWDTVSNNNSVIYPQNMEVTDESPLHLGIGNGYILTSAADRSNLPFCHNNVGTYNIYRGMYYREFDTQNYIGGGGATYSGIITANIENLDQSDKSNFNNFAVAYELIIEVVDSQNSGTVGSGKMYLLGNVDGSVGSATGKTVKQGQSQTKTEAQTDNITSVNNVSNNGTVENITVDNLTDFINNGLGMKGDNGFISILQKTLSFLPNEIWVLIFCALSISIVLMIVKVIRGM